MDKNNKTTVYLQGGLGNQLFQYAFFLTIKKMTKVSVIDVGRCIYDGQHQGVSLVNFFCIPSSEYTNSKNDALPLLIIDTFTGKFVRYFCRKLNIRRLFTSYYDYDAMSTFEEIPSNVTNYVGYFQFVESAIKTKANFENMLRELYPNQLKSYSISYKNKIGLHIRRGDFVSSKDPKHKSIELDYIKRAIDISSQKIVVFSDDINWCKEALSGYESLDFHCGESAFDDFIALSQCTNYILSGSTFSWWAAFLFSSPHTKILQPRGLHTQFSTDISNDKIGWIYSEL